jgi:hypothetical protein
VGDLKFERWRRYSLVLLMVVVFTMNGCRIADAAPVAPADGYGFSVGASQTWMSPADADRELDAAAKAGGTWMRVLVDWHVVEANKGQFNWGYVDHWVDGARRRGMKVLAVIAYTPNWVRDPGAYFTAPPTNPADFAAFATTVVQRYGDRVSDWEVWNEPNLPLFFGYAQNPAATYAQLLKAVYPAIKAAQPNGTVVSGGLSRAVGVDAPTNFLNGMYAAGVKGSFDAFAMHPYVFPGGISQDLDNGWSDLARVHDIMSANGDGDKKIWMTEMGAATSAPTAQGVTQEEQAKQIVDVLAGVAATGWSGPAFIYSIRDTDSAKTDDDQSNFGALLTSDWKPKYAASVLASRN